MRALSYSFVSCSSAAISGSGANRPPNTPKCPDTSGTTEISGSAGGCPAAGLLFTGVRLPAFYPRSPRRAGCDPAVTRSATADLGSFSVTSDSPTSTASAPDAA